MDFGDILAQWSEAQKKEKSAAKKPASQVSHKKANAPTPEEKEIEKRNIKTMRKKIRKEKFKRLFKK